jgi:spore cortex formation protein SpoVR/YcgB (stage V sporulation)
VRAKFTPGYRAGKECSPGVVHHDHKGDGGLALHHEQKQVSLRRTSRSRVAEPTKRPGPFESGPFLLSHLS